MARLRTGLQRRFTEQPEVTSQPVAQPQPAAAPTPTAAPQIPVARPPASPAPQVASTPPVNPFEAFRLGDTGNAQGGLGGLVDIANAQGGLGQNFDAVRSAALRELPGRFTNDATGGLESDVVIADRIRRLFGESGTTGQGDLFFEGGARRSGSFQESGNGGGAGGGATSGPRFDNGGQTRTPGGGFGGTGGGGGGLPGGGFPPQSPPGVPPHPGNTPPGIFPTQPDPQLDPNNFDPSLGAPQQQGIDFGTSPFSQMIEQFLSGVITEGGQPLSPFAQQTRQAIGGQLASLQPGEVTGQSQNALSDILSGGANIESFIDPRIINQNTQSLRENLDRQRRSQTDQLEARLADRGLIGSGTQRGGLSRIERDIAEQFVQGQRQIGTDELSRARGSFENAVGIGEAGRQFDIGAQGDLLGLSQNAASQDQASLLTALGQGTSRQGLLAGIAQQLVDSNQSAAEFAAQFGMNREQLLEQLQRLDINQLNTLIQNFIGAAGTAQRGAVGTPR